MLNSGIFLEGLGSLSPKVGNPMASIVKSCESQHELSEKSGFHFLGDDENGSQVLGGLRFEGFGGLGPKYPSSRATGVRKCYALGAGTSLRVRWCKSCI